MSNGSETEAATADAEKVTPHDAAADPVRKWTLILLGLCVVLMFWYLRSDRVTPYTTQARVHTLVVPIATQVSANVINVSIGNNETVKAGQELFRLDPASYEIAVETARAQLKSARQSTGASTAAVEAARASVGTAQASLVRAEQDAVRMRRIKLEDAGAISDRRLEQTEGSLSIAQSKLVGAKANLEKAIQDLGQTGDQNSAVQQAQTALEQAELNLERTVIVAPADGLVTDLRLDRGNFAAAGSPQMTFIASDEIWVQADFTENNLGRMKLGDTVRMVFDALPGEILRGEVRDIGYGVNVDSAPLGTLPSIDNDRQWLRDAQRFPVRVEFQLNDASDRQAIRVGAQVSVMAFTGEHWLFNPIGRFYLWVVSYMTYAV